MSAPTLLVLAAGMGSRYGGLKQVVPVNAAGDTIVDYSVFDAIRAGFGEVVFVIRKEIEQAFKATIGTRFEQRIGVAYAFQELDSLPAGFAVPQGRVKPWGTLHATVIGTEKIKGSFAVINSDDFYGADSYRVVSQHLQSDAVTCAMVGFTLRNTLSAFGSVSRGVCSVDGNGLLVNTFEKTDIVPDGAGARSIEGGKEVQLSGDEIVSMNMWGFTPAIVPLLHRAFLDFLAECGSDPRAEAYLPKAVNHIVVDGQVRVDVLRTNDTWCGVTYPEDHGHVVETLANLTRQGKYPEKLWP